MAKCISALVLVFGLASVSAVRAQDTARPLGTWVRKIGKSRVTLIVEENRLHVTVQGENPCTLHADYALSRDGVVFGVITSLESEEEAEEEADRGVIDAPFSCRFRIDEGALLVRDLKCHPFLSEGNNRDNGWSGRFKAVTPAPARTASTPPPPAPSSLTLASIRYLIAEAQQPRTPSLTVPAPLNDKDLIEYYYKIAWPEALRPAAPPDTVKPAFTLIYGFDR